jgi:hypothetical protein
MQSPSSFGSAEVPDTWLLLTYVDLRPSIPRQQQSISFDRRTSTMADMNEQYCMHSTNTINATILGLKSFALPVRKSCLLSYRHGIPVVLQWTNNRYVAMQALASTVLARLPGTLSFFCQKMGQAIATAHLRDPPMGTDRHRQQATRFHTRWLAATCGAWRKVGASLSDVRASPQIGDPDRTRPGDIVFV